MPISYAVLNPDKFTMKINHHRCRTLSLRASALDHHIILPVNNFIRSYYNVLYKMHTTFVYYSGYWFVHIHLRILECK
jgi:hypothetical protein